MKILVFAVLAFVGAGLGICDIAKAERVDVVIGSSNTQAGNIQSSGNQSIVAAARRYIGTNPTGNRYLWCMDFVNKSLDRAGYQSTGLRAARSILSHGRSVRRREARPGDIVFRPRRRGGHVEIFVRWTDDQRTHYIAITGNSCGPRGRRHVCEIRRPASRIWTLRRLERGRAT